MPLVVNSLGGGHTHANTCIHIDIHIETILRNQVCAAFDWRTPGLKIVYVFHIDHLI